MNEFLFTGGELAKDVILKTDYLEDNANFTVQQIVYTDGSLIGYGPLDGDASLGAILNFFPIAPTDIHKLKTFSIDQGLSLTLLTDDNRSPLLVNVVLSGLSVGKVLFQSGHKVRYVISGTTDLSGIPTKGLVRLFCKGNGQTLNDGIFPVLAVSDGTAGVADSKYIEVDNVSRSDKTGDETTAAQGKCNVILE